MKKVVIYLRVSTDEQRKLGYSIPHQETVLRKACEIRGWEVAEIFIEDFSAKNFERPTYKSLFRYCKNNKASVDYVLVTKWDRFSRNVGHALAEIEKLNKFNIEVNAMEEWIDFSIPQNYLLLAVYLAMPEVDNKVRAINVINGIRGSWKSGRWTGIAPVGFSNGRDSINKPILLKNEDAPLVAEAFELFSTGLYEKQQLRKIMWKKGLRVSKSRFPMMLINPIYCGRVIIPAYKTEPQTVVQGIHQPIIAESLFEKVQSIINRSKKRISRRWDHEEENTPLRGLLVCSACGRMLTSSESKGKRAYYWYYHCRNRCKERVNAARTHEALAHTLNSLSIDPDIASLFLKVKQNYYENQKHESARTARTLKGKIKAAEDRLVNLEDKYINNEIDKESYQRMRPIYQLELRQFKAEVDGLKEYDRNKMEYVKSAVNIIQHARQYYDEAPTVALKQMLVSSIFGPKIFIKNGNFRTPHESVTITVLRGFSPVLNENGCHDKHPFPLSSLYGCHIIYIEWTKVYKSGNLGKNLSTPVY